MGIGRILKLVAGLILTGISLSVATVQAGNRVALIIGNADYSTATLRNPVNDANDMAATLNTLGFDEVMLETNVDAIGMNRALRKFGKMLNGAEIGLFFYAGHGLQVRGRNYLIPVGSDIAAEDEVPFRAVDAGQVLAKMESAGNPINLVFLDSCRDNPFARSWRGSSRGLAQMDSPKGSLVAYATAPGRTASDGEGRNGVFTGALINALKEPDIDIALVLRKVSREVRTQTDDQQVPWVSSSLAKEVVLNITADKVEITVTPKPTDSGGVSDMNAQTAFWSSITASDSPSDYDDYLKQWPNGVFAPLARRRLAALTDVKQNNPVKTTPSEQPVKSADRANPEILLAECRTHFAAKRLTSGVNGTALDCYNHVLEVFPGNRDALQGLNNIETTYANWAMRDIAAGKFSKAGRHRDKLASLNSGHSQLPIIEQQLSELTAWKSASSNNDVQAYQSYLGRFPNGSFSSLARIKIKNLAVKSGTTTRAKAVNQAKSAKSSTTKNNSSTTSKAGLTGNWRGSVRITRSDVDDGHLSPLDQEFSVSLVGNDVSKVSGTLKILHGGSVDIDCRNAKATISKVSENKVRISLLGAACLGKATLRHSGGVISGRVRLRDPGSGSAIGTITFRRSD